MGTAGIPVGNDLFPPMFSPFASLVRVVLAVLALSTGSRARDPVSLFANGRPIFILEKFFAGRTHSWGVFERRSGAPKQTLTTKTNGVWQDGILHFEQDIAFADGKRQHRSWRIRRLDEHHYSATGTGIVGTARGEAWGNAFHLDFTMAVLGANPLGHVHMSQWLYLQEDGVTLINRATATKAGIIVAEITEQFRKDR